MIFVVNEELVCVLQVTESGEESVFELKKMEEEVIEEENDVFTQAVKECFMNEESKATADSIQCLQEKLQMKCAPKEEETTEEEKE
ncbi:hypothetical protein CEXT_756321 [Caerostris extrusa]|uniref:Uncharacterized protein n=1 Tax=Caerostris extrusa TaxID=172846 RepID=A0AAV4QLJ7_CAEEX|nr:hypothetical protein CEXT_756321 [Caerostris extrusa]